MPKHVVPKVFQPLWSPARYKGARGGRGSGKSHNFAAMAVSTAISNPGSRGVCIREVQKSLKDSAKLLIEDTLNAFNMGEEFNVQTAEVRTPGGGVIVFNGMQDHTAQSIKSLEGFLWAWIEEAQTLSKYSLELLRPTLRKEESEIWASWNPRSANDPIDLLLNGETLPPRSVVVNANYVDNQFFPQVLEEERAHDEVHSPDRYDHIWMGGYEPQALGAIWTRQTLHNTRLKEKPVLERILVGVDPAVTDETDSNEHGITVCGRDERGHGYLIEDASMHGSPHAWASRAVSMFDKWEADAVVIEVNQGGDMCRHTLQTIRKGLPIIEVRATRGKHVRAEPISALYETGQIHHVGTYTELENQLCLFTPHGWEGPDRLSPDRAESAIWCFTSLFPELTRERNERPQERAPLPQGAWMG